MKKTRAKVMAAIVAGIGLAVSGSLLPAVGQVSPPQGRASGAISISGLVLSGTQFGTPTGNPTLVPTRALRLPLREGRNFFRYSSIQCRSGPAPYNNVGLDFSPNYPGVVDPASIRSVMTGIVTQASPSGDRGLAEGTITSYLCENGVETDQITVYFQAQLRSASPTTIFLRGGSIQTTGGVVLEGRFEIIDGTGRFEDMTGAGSLRIHLTCLPSTLTRNNAANCSALGAFSEGVLDLGGRFRDPTVPAV
jgi:hypothetical protein